MGNWLSFITSLPTEDANFIALFVRSADYAVLLSEVAQIRESLRPESVQEIIKQARKLRRAFSAIVEIDFFLDVAQRQAESALQYCTLPRTCAGNAATPMDRPVGQRLADPPLHRPIRPDSLDQESCRLPARSGWCGKCARLAARTPSSTTIDYWPQHLTCLTDCWQVLTKEYPRNEST